MRGSGYHSKAAPVTVLEAAQHATRILAGWPFGLTRRDLMRLLFADATVPDFRRGQWTANALLEAAERGWVTRYGRRWRVTQYGKQQAELADGFDGGAA